MTQPIIRIATLNIRNTADGWRVRRDLLVEQLIELEPEIIGIQEVRHIPNQADWITGRINRGAVRPYAHRTTWKTGLRRWWEGISVLTRLPILGHSSIELRGGHRVAQRVSAQLSDGGQFDFYNIHLHHAPNRDALRLGQSRRILEWMDERPGVPRALVGDFNAQPEDPTIRQIAARMRSAFFGFHGSEPDRTAPTSLGGRGERLGHVIDFIFVSEDIEIHNAWRTFERGHPDDDAVTASDHFGVAAEISIKRT